MINKVIKNSKERKEYMANIYSKNWIRKREEYGVEQYDKDLIYQLSKKVKNGKILEVGIGDGFPYSNMLDTMGYEIYGIDISPKLIDVAKKLLPNINVKVGDAENLEFTDNFFDVVFCFRSTWYFPDIIKSISEMLRVLKNDGLIMFDIQNSNHLIHKKRLKVHQRRQKNYIRYIGLKYIKNIIKILIRPIKFYSFEWSLTPPILFETPTDPNNINTYLQMRKDIEFKLYGVNWNHSSTLQEINTKKDLDQFDRLVYKIIKIKNEGHDSILSI